MVQNESDVQGSIQIEGPRHGSILLRNNSGAFKDERGVVVRFGLGNISKDVNERMKSSDLIGPTTVTITLDMVGKKIAVFTAIEAKRPNWKFSGDKREVAQLNFINWIRSLGGIAGFAASIEDFRKILGA